MVLVAHNGFRFDAPVLTRELILFNMWAEFKSVVTGFADTLPLFKEKLPERVTNKESFKQEVLADDLLPAVTLVAMDAHNALSDVQVLHALIDKLGLLESDIVESAKPVNFVMILDRQKRRSKQAEITLLPLKQHGLSSAMVTKLAKADLNLSMLKESYLGGGLEALKPLLAEKVTKHTGSIKKKFSALQAVSGDNRK